MVMGVLRLTLGYRTMTFVMVPPPPHPVLFQHGLFWETILAPAEPMTEILSTLLLKVVLRGVRAACHAPFAQLFGPQVAPSAVAKRC